MTVHDARATGGIFDVVVGTGRAGVGDPVGCGAVADGHRHANAAREPVSVDAGGASVGGRDVPGAAVGHVAHHTDVVDGKSRGLA